MSPCRMPVPRERRQTRALGLRSLVQAATLMLPLMGALLLGGCSSDDASSTSSARGARSPAGARTGATDRTSDSGSRFLDAAAPLGGLTVETPPTALPQERESPDG